MFDDELSDIESDGEGNEERGELPIVPGRDGVLRKKRRDSVTGFLGEGPRSFEVHSTDWYYRSLLAWSVKRVTSSSGWEVVSTHGYSYDQPAYRNLQIDYAVKESCLVNGQVFMKKDGVRLAVTLVAKDASVVIEATADHEALVKQAVHDIAAFMEENNFFKGKRITLGDEIVFLDAVPRDWDSVILDDALKTEIRLNTVGFLRNYARFEGHGIPAKRGIILAGEPGTGKTIVCQALMSEAEGITCISSNAYGVLDDGYISCLYSVAQDLSPSIVFLEDVDLIAYGRHGYDRGTPPLVALLAEMDGIAKRRAIVTVATSNNFETLDKALSERPSRFDRVFKLTRPGYEQRWKLVKRLSGKIPLSEEVMEHLVSRTNGLTPAQVQEVVFGMVISRGDMNDRAIQFSCGDVDSALAWIGTRKNGAIGFSTTPYHRPNGTAVQSQRAQDL